LSSSEAPLLEARGIHKRFPGVHALRGVDLEVRGGEVLAVLGENGAGKSTLMKCLAGLQEPDEGRLLVAGEERQVDSPRRAAELGIALVHQELGLADNLDAAANVFLGREPARGGLIDEAELSSRATELLRRVGARFDPRTPVASLSPGQRQQVEIAKALASKPRVLILDEPTSSLSATETEQLFELVRELRSEGLGLVYISHALAEVTLLASRALVLRDGERVGELQEEELQHDRMVAMMVGRELEVREPRRLQPGELRLEVRGLRTAAWPGATVDLELRAGEKVALAGLVGAGRTELLRCLFGIDRPAAGEVRAAGSTLPLDSPRAAMGAGLALVPEDRKELGVLLEQSVRENLSLACLTGDRRDLRSGGGLGLLRRGEERRLAREQMEALDVRASSMEQLVGLLSGGNQQKVVLGRWLATGPTVLLLDEPTRGIDVGARQEIYARLDELSVGGMAILFASSEMEEVLTLADRILVLHEGRLSGELRGEEATEEDILALALGAGPALRDSGKRSDEAASTGGAGEHRS